MYITSLVPRGKTRTGVTFDEDVTLVLSNADLVRYGISEGAEIPSDVYETIRSQVGKEALRKCAGLLQDMDYTEAGLRAKLIRSGYPEDIAGEAAQAAKTAGLIDDLRYAQDYIRYHMGDRSCLRIRADLAGKGVPEGVMDEAFRLWEEDEAVPSLPGEDEADRPQSPRDAAELNQIRRILRKRRYDPDTATREEEQRLIAYLQYKGYSLSLIRRGLDAAGQTPPMS